MQDNTSDTEETRRYWSTQTTGSSKMVQERVIPENAATTTQITMDKASSMVSAMVVLSTSTSSHSECHLSERGAGASSMVSAMVVLSTSTSFGKIAFAVRCFME